MNKLLVLNGPNLNLLGAREPDLYGSDTLETIVNRLTVSGEKHGIEIAHQQSNAEHVLVDRVHQAQTDGVAFIIINPAAFTHTSVALRDALAAVQIPFIEVHLSNVHARESFRAHSYFSDIAVGSIIGLGALGYELALKAAITHIHKTR